MHRVEIRREIVERVMARRGRLHLYDALDPKRTALVVIDMQNAFVAPGAPVEVPGARDIVPAITRLAAGLRDRGSQVVWVSHANVARGGRTDWETFYGHFVSDEGRARAAAALAPGAELQQLWPGMVVAPEDLHVAKNRYSPFVPGASQLERVLRNLGVDTLLIAGTKTNVCCECTARDAMMLDFKVVMLSDCTAALSDDEQRTTLENVIQQFGDVLSADEALALLDRGRDAA